MTILCCIGIIFSIVVIIVQQIFLRNATSKSKQLEIFEQQYRDAQLENVKLSEKCRFLELTEQKYEQLKNDYQISEQKNIQLTETLRQERKNFEEKASLIKSLEDQFKNTFKALSADALSENNKSFLDLAQMAFAKIQEKNKSELDLSAKNMEHLVTPIKQTLSTVGEQLNALEKSRIGAYEALQQQVKDLLHSQNLLKNETTQLVSALKAPASRGRWGEIQLRRVVELAGMIKHCDFDEQVSVTNDDKKVRPDMIIHYPGGKQVIVDSKVPLTAYLKSLEVSDENEKKSLLAEHARQVRAHVVDLARKEYWTYITPSPEFVVMFLPGETFLSLALEQDPTLIEFAMKEHVIITTPTTFLALLHTVACGWKQNDMETNAQAIIKMGQELYDRLRKISEHFEKLGNSLANAVTHYNNAISSFESRILVSARKFKELSLANKEIKEPLLIDTATRSVKSTSVQALPNSEPNQEIH